MYASADNTLPPAVVHTLQAAGIDLGQNDHITQADLNASFEAAGIAPADRIVEAGVGAAFKGNRLMSNRQPYPPSKDQWPDRDADRYEGRPNTDGGLVTVRVPPHDELPPTD